MNLFPEQDSLIAKIEHLFQVVKKSENDTECTIRPHFFVTGPTGTGKTHIIQTAAGKNKMPTFTINAAQLTAEGLSGNSLSKAMRPLRMHWDKPNVIFVDEFDKLFQRNGETQGEHQTAVQDEFLGVLEATKASVFTDYGKYEPVSVAKTIFVFAGAFNGQKLDNHKALKEAGMRPEFIGRVPLIFMTDEISLDSIIESVEHMPVFQEYIRISPKHQRNKPKALKDIRAIIRENYEDNEIGLRAIPYTIHQYFMKDL